MASSSHNLHPPSCQETLSTICHGKTNAVCHSLSLSYSNLPSSESGEPERNPEIHRSLNSLLCMPKHNKTSIQYTQSSELSPTQDSLPVLCPVQQNCSYLLVDQLQENILHRNRYLSADSSLASTGQEVTRNFVRCNVSENISLLVHSDSSVCQAENVDRLDIPRTKFQKSYSDYFCSSRNSVPCSARVSNTSSPTYFNLSSSSSISGSGSDGTTLSNVTQDSGIVHSPSNIQNNLSDVSPVSDQNISLCHLDSSTIQHNITVYAVPGTYQHGILGPRNSGNGFPNNGHIYGQPHYNIPGVMSCDNISETKLSPPAMIIQNSCSVHLCKGPEPLVKEDDMVAAYCHSLPIPSLQFSSSLVHSGRNLGSGCAAAQFCSQLPTPEKFSFPKLVSSISESGLDAKKLMRCGKLTILPPAVSNSDLHLNSLEQANNPSLDDVIETSLGEAEIPDSGAKTRDTWTMTSMNHLSVEHRIPLNCKDAEVQTIILMENKSVSTTPCLQHTGHSHLCPDVGLSLNLQCPQSPLREVRWDDEGRTWEVYGAAVDPEVLGLAIQKHLEIQIEQNLQPELSGETEQSSKEKRRTLRTVMHSLRQWDCCVRTNSTSE